MNRRKKWSLLLTAAGAIVLAIAAVLTGTAGAATRAPTQICNVPNPSTVNCVRDPGNGGSGTPIVMAGRTSGPTEDFALKGDPEFCNNHGFVTSGCGLPGFLVSRYSGDTVVVWKQAASGHCLKIAGPGTTSGEAFMGTCFDNNTILILATCNHSRCYYVSITESEAIGAPEWICGPPAGRQVFAGSGPACNAADWEFVSS